MRSSAAFDRGLMVHLKGSGWLIELMSTLNSLEPDIAHLTIELVYSTSVAMNDPSWSTALEMLKVESTPATVRPSRETAMWFPGHILIDHFSTSRDRAGFCPKNDLPSTKPECHQCRISDVGIKLAVLQIPFGFERWWIGIVGFVIEHRPVSKRQI